MRMKRTDEFGADAVRVVLKQVASHSGVGLSALNTWGVAHCDADVVSNKGLDRAGENERLRRENRTLNDLQGLVNNPRDCLPAAREIF